MSADSVVQVVSARLDYLLQEEGAPVTCGSDLRNMIEQLRSDLSAIEQSLLRSKAKMKIQAVRNQNDTEKGGFVNFNKQVIQLAYDLENAVECHALQERISSSGGLKAIFKLCSGKKNCSPLDSLNKRIDELKLVHFDTEIIEEGQRDQDPSRGNTSSSTAAGSSRSPREIIRTGSFIDKNVVDITELRSMLLEGNVVNTRRIAIVGMGGIGKTTLARKVFNDPAVVRHFDCRAWACVSQEFGTRNVLGDILGSLYTLRSRDEIARMEIMELMEQLYKVQKGRKCLIVIDDVWSTDTWETMRRAFPMDPGTAIIITTRLTDVAMHFSGQVYRIRTWTDAQSWELFKEKSGLQDSDIKNNPHIQDTVNKLVSQCQGLPLAIVVIADLLKGKKLEDWDKVLHAMQFEDRKSDEQSVLEILSFSYDHLPLHLKQCLLYLVQFPPDQPIPAEKLYSLWMAEGLIVSTARPSSIVERLKFFEEYLKDLAERGFVIIAEIDRVSAINRINSCRIHDLVREFCILQGKRDEFFEVVDFTKGIEKSSLTSRIAVYLDDYIHADVDDTTSYIPEANHIRSLIFFDKDKSLSKSTWPEEFADLKDFQWTRVLDFDGVDFRGANNNKLLPKNIDKLLYLRYLGFRGCYLEKLKLSCTDFLYLETLDLRVTSSCKMIIPNVLWNLSNLLHLYFPVSFQSGDQNKLIKLDGLTRLEILENFCVGICDVGDFQQFKRLQMFTVLYKDGNTRDLNKIIEFINGNKYLHHTSLTLEKFDCYSKARRTLLVDMLASHAIQCLHLEGHLRRMPKDLIIGQNFTKMVFNGCEFLEDPMPILGRVQQLKILILCNDAIEGNEIICPESSFEELRSLEIANLQYLDNWKLDSVAMPNLSILTIKQCGKLHMLPDELVDIVTLTELNIGSMSEVFEEKVRQIAKEQLEKGNGQLTATFYKCK